jgi:hypothetical protein
MPLVRWYLYLIKTKHQPKKTNAMKTTKIIFALGLALLFAIGFNNLYAQKAAKVAYVVRIENMNYLLRTGGHYLVMMTDENGSLVAPTQTVRKGVTDYTFIEGGTVRGTRVAKVMQLPIGPKSFNIPSCSKTGIFYGGASYLFIIHPVPAETKATLDVH